MAARVSKHLEADPNEKVEYFNIDKITSKNVINHILVMKQSDISYSVIMTLFGSFNGKNICHHYDTFTVPVGGFSFENEKGKIVSNTNKFITTIGIWVFNIFFLQGFGFSKFFNGYINENIDSDKFEDINQQLAYYIIEDKIDTETYIKFLNYQQFFMPFETILSPNHTEKMLSCTKLVSKKKEQLIKENKEAIENGDVVVAERIEKELLNFVLDYLKDDPSVDVYLSGAGGTLANNFKNMYVMKGAIKDPDPNAKQKYNIVTSNYLDGIKADEYSLIANSLAAGPYSRSKKTEIGGYWEGLFSAAMQTITIDEPGSDCGTKKYIRVELTKKNIKDFMYNWIVEKDGSLIELTSENKDKYIGKIVNMRFSIFCKSKTGICSKCAGNFFYRRTNGKNRNIGLATIQIASKLKLKSMKAFHDSTVSTVEIDPMKAFNIK